MKKWIYFSIIAVLAASLFASCTDDDDSDLAGPASAMITAADGGTLATSDNKASIEIPPGALAADTQISITPIARAGQPDEANLGSDVYDFGPDGTEFLKPVTIGLAFEGNAPKGQKAVLAYLEGQKWTAVSGSAAAAGKVSGSVTHFTKFVILFVGENAIIDTPACNDLNFTPCGGDLVGTWKVKDICSEDTAIGQNPFAQVPACQDTVFEMEINYTGTWTINSNGTYEGNLGAGNSTIHMELDADCIAALGQGTDPATYCAGIAESFGTCVYEATSCVCDDVMDFSDDQDTDTSQEMGGTWSVSGNNVTVDDNQGDPSTMEFCVDGNTCILKSTETAPDAGSNTMNYIVLEKI